MLHPGMTPENPLMKTAKSAIWKFHAQYLISLFCYINKKIFFLQNLFLTLNRLGGGAFCAPPLIFHTIHREIF